VTRPNTAARFYGGPATRGGGGVAGLILEEVSRSHKRGQVAGTCGYGEGLSGSIITGNFLTNYKVYWLASQEGLCSME
jgi:hypothetical protein